ncbi:MAG TPA: helix-turn-helix domain-containing protein [Vicinamibacteria bacterium]|nr:helix-turn-helix domain-containing protein [Vicinamibacteria bacterium]
MSDPARLRAPGATELFITKRYRNHDSLLADALREAEGNQARAARSLGVRYHQLRHYLAKHRLGEES